MIYQFITNSMIHFATALAACFTVILLWKFRKSSEVRFLIYLEFFVGIWATAYAFEFASPEFENKILWSKISYLGIAFLPVCYFLFTTAFSKKKKFISTKNIALLLILPVIIIVLVFTNDRHLLVWPSVTLDATNNIVYYGHGPAFWVFFAFAQILLALGLINLVRSIYKFQAYYKRQGRALLIATLFPIIGNLLYVTDLNPYPGFDWTPISFVLTGLIIALAIFRYRMFNIIPLAKTKLFETLADGVVVINSEGFIEDCNSAVYAVFNWQKKSLIREPFNKVFKKYTKLQDALNENMASIQLEVPHQNWSNYYQVKISPIYNENNFSGHILIFHDITSIINAEAELKNTNKKLLFEIDKREKLIEDLDAFAHTVAHDLRSSLSSIFSASEIMEEIININDKNLLCELSNLINHSANKSIQITHELLLLATTDKTEVERKPLDMKTIFNESLRQHEDLIESSEAQITFPESWPEAIGYAPWIEEVWSNYISNAIKYGGHPPEIQMGAKELKTGKIKFWVSDNGKGLTTEEQKKLFKNFVRLNPQKADGYGLGLSIVKKIVEKLDGAVGVESHGNGSKFYFTLPSTNKKSIKLQQLTPKAEFLAN